jgi:hypothetical protein
MRRTRPCSTRQWSGPPGAGAPRWPWWLLEPLEGNPAAQVLVGGQVGRRPCPIPQAVQNSVGPSRSGARSRSWVAQPWCSGWAPFRMARALRASFGSRWGTQAQVRQWFLGRRSAFPGGSFRPAQRTWRTRRGRRARRGAPATGEACGARMDAEFRAQGLGEGRQEGIRRPGRFLRLRPLALQVAVPQEVGHGPHRNRSPWGQRWRRYGAKRSTGRWGPRG